LITESLVGVDVTAIRQNGGKPVCVAVDPGGVKLPLVTDCATVIVACGSATPARLSQVCAVADAPEQIAANESDHTNSLGLNVMRFLRDNG
jgi:hypothetical protein